MKKSIQYWLRSLLVIVLVCGLALTGCSTPKANSLNMDNYVPRLEGTATVEMTVNGSPITIAVDGKNAPITAGNFVDLVDRGVYNGLTFHRVVKDPEPFVAQGGDPKGNGTGSFVDPKTKQARYIPLEIKLKGQEKPLYSQAIGRQGGYAEPPVELNHKRGAVAMARSQMPDSASSQFYFALSDLGFLDGDYAVFGYVTSGMEAVDKINQGDRIESAKVVSGLENLKK
jgi:peptidyl-prolyl cis-trans isomerase B (cyclophilin B)